jgi:ubiquinone/menaquinone biosynthesis C-methylase UbiE
MIQRWPERIDPVVEPPGVLAHHLKKYEFARQIVGGVVADVACGLGYGSAHLAGVAEVVVGIDISTTALRIARERYSGKHVLFVRADAESLPMRDNVADAVICFEGIEHFPNPSRHVEEVARVLARGGVFLLSTPRAGSRGGHCMSRPENPHHLHEFSSEELNHLLREWFDQVQILGQRRLKTSAYRVAQRIDFLDLRKRSWFRPVAKALARFTGTVPIDEASLEDFAIDHRVDEALDLVAICRDPKS